MRGEERGFVVGGEVREGRSGDTPTRVSALGGGTSEEGVTGRERDGERERDGYGREERIG